MKDRAGARLYVTAPVNALVEGLYQQDSSMAEVLAHGDFGIGTFNDLDGEMVVVDGRVYQLRADGVAHAVDAQTRTPFACVTRFRPYSFEDIAQVLDYGELIALLGRLLPSPNMLYAIRIDGVFAHVRVRSVPRQESYRPLLEVARDLPEFEFDDSAGTLVGFWTPAFLQSIAVPGFHFHFLTHDRTRGGHLLDCRPRQIRISLQHIARLELGLPLTLDYLTAELGRDIGADLEQVEK